MSRRGFTLIELLVVVTVVIVLVGLLVPAAGMLRERARWLDTSNRIENARRALATAGSTDESSAVWIQRHCGIGGAIRLGWGLNDTDPALRGSLRVEDGTFLDYVEPWELRFPLGRGAVRFDQQGAYRWDNGHSSWQLMKLVEVEPIDFALGAATARFSGELLSAAGIAPDAGAYLGDRDPAAPWNDAWGHPLLLGLAIFQYGPATAASASRWPWAHGPGERPHPSPDFTAQWQKVAKHYGGNRQIALAIGSVGPRPDAPLAAPLDATALDALWATVDRVCNRAADGSPLWRIDGRSPAPLNAVAAPPWDGLRRAAEGRQRCLLSLPTLLD